VTPNVKVRDDIEQVGTLGDAQRVRRVDSVRILIDRAVHGH
jgi:hypothetical protein